MWQTRWILLPELFLVVLAASLAGAEIRSIRSTGTLAAKAVSSPATWRAEQPSRYNDQTAGGAAIIIPG